MIHNRKPLLATTRRGFQTKHRSSVPVVSPRLAELVSSSSGSRSGGPEHLDETSANELRRSALTPQIVLNGLDTLTITAGGVVSPTNWLIEQQYIWSEYQKQYQH